MVIYCNGGSGNIGASITYPRCINADVHDFINSIQLNGSNLEIPIIYLPLVNSHDSAGKTVKYQFSVDLWLISINAAAALQSLARVLSAGDWQLINLRKIVSARNSAIASHVCLRFALSSLVHWNHSPAAWRIGRTPFGRPFVEHGPNVNFSLTHAGTFDAIALSQAYPLGIDAETTAPDIFADEMEDYLSPREKNIARCLPGGLREREFLRLWTLKEAFVKSTGLGLSTELSDIDVSSVAPGRASIHTVCGWQTVFLTSPIRDLGLVGDGWLSLAINVSGSPSAIRLNIYRADA